MPSRNRPTGNKPEQANLSGSPSRSTPNLSTWRPLKVGGTARSDLPSQPSYEAAENAQGARTNVDLTPRETGATSQNNGSREPSLLLSGASDDDDDSSDSEDNDNDQQRYPNNNPLARPRAMQHSRSHTYLGPSAFAPPFYNRPPTPLPPSPSLTSLLRPNFSTQNSRPSTPDLSSDEATPHMRDATGIQTPNSAAASALNSTYRNAETIPRASPKVPTYEYYGFTLYLTSSLAFIVYVLWAFLPSPLLHQLGIYYYPNRWWALAIPAWTVMLVLYIYVALAAYNLGHLTLPLQSIECLVDEAAQIAVVDDRGQIVRNDRPSWRTGSPERGARGARGTSSSRIPLREGQRGVNGGQSRTSSLHRGPAREDLEWRSLWKEGTDAVMDIPIGGVCEILYGGPGHDDEEGVEG